MMTNSNQLRRAQCLELIGSVASGVAHDLNNQLTVIVNYLHFAMEGLTPDSPVRGNLTDVLHAANRCTEMVGTLMGLGRQETRFKSMDLLPVLSQTTRLLQRVIPAGIQLHLTAKSLMPVMADATQIQQMVVNLAINARDAMPGNGTIAIEAYNEKDRVVLSVRDSGAGISKDQLPHIFEPFYTTKGETGGSGLGLAMVKTIVEEHSGTIAVESEPGKGTCFVLTFPAAID